MEPIWLTLSSPITFDEPELVEVVQESQLCEFLKNKLKDSNQTVMKFAITDFIDLLLDYYNALQEYVQKKIKEAGSTEDLMLLHNRNRSN